MKFKLTTVLVVILFSSMAPVWADKNSSLKTEKEKLGYAIGYQSGMGFRRWADDIDVDVFLRALKDAMTGQGPVLSNEQMRSAVKKYQQTSMKERQAKAESNMKAGASFLAENKKKSGVKTLPSGLQYRVVTKGKGKHPKPTDTVVVHYRGTLINGTEFDSSHKRGQPATFPIGGVIKGWQEVLPLMKEGAKWNVVIPPVLAYGDRGAGPLIGPNETLVFDIELVSIK